MEESKKELRLKVKIKEPSMYDVVFFNDDFTTMEFVVDILMSIYQHTEQEATSLMLTIHHEGKASVGTYVLDVAVSKCEKTKYLASQEGFPLNVEVQKH